MHVFLLFKNSFLVFLEGSRKCKPYWVAETMKAKITQITKDKFLVLKLYSMPGLSFKAIPYYSKSLLRLSFLNVKFKFYREGQQRTLRFKLLSSFEVHQSYIPQNNFVQNSSHKRNIKDTSKECSGENNRFIIPKDHLI